jgi:hypothetical protein
MLMAIMRLPNPWHLGIALLVLQSYLPKHDVLYHPRLPYLALGCLVMVGELQSETLREMDSVFEGREWSSTPRRKQDSQVSQYRGPVAPICGYIPESGIAQSVFPYVAESDVATSHLSYAVRERVRCQPWI